MKKKLSQERLFELVDFNKETGLFSWKITRGKCRAGLVFGTKLHNGYLRVEIDGTSYALHRLAFLYVTGEFPENEVDHINRIRDDNRFGNLRLVDRFGNMANKGLYKTSKTGYTGVYQREGKFRAVICRNKQTIQLGHFPSLEDAVKARQSAIAEI